MRYVAEVVYKGTNYHGWQIQPNALTVQEVVEDRLGVFLRHPVSIVASGRTDAGVHGEQQFVHFDSEVEINPERFHRALNALLTKGIAIKQVFPVKDDFHARFSALSRGYRYQIRNQKDPFNRDLFWQRSIDLDVEAMNRVAENLLGRHDFECFSKVRTDVHTFFCDIEYAYWERVPHGLNFHIKANRFLRGMVRAIVGTLVEVGEGKLDEEGFKAIIANKDRKQAGYSAPPQGLFLTKIGYEWEKWRLESKEEVSGIK